MEYKISDICESLHIGKSTIYKRIELLKKQNPDIDHQKNDYFYYDNKKLFITQKGFEYIKDFKSNNIVKDSSSGDVVVYQNKIIEMYQQRIDFLESENKRLLDIIAFKEQKELAANVKQLSNNKEVSWFGKIINKFKNDKIG